jgi:hypothetical protein
MRYSCVCRLQKPVQHVSRSWLVGEQPLNPCTPPRNVTELWLWKATFSVSVALFVWTYQQNQQSSSSVFLSQQTSEQCFQHNKPAKRTDWVSAVTTEEVFVTEVTPLFTTTHDACNGFETVHANTHGKKVQLAARGHGMCRTPNDSIRSISIMSCENLSSFSANLVCKSITKHGSQQSVKPASALQLTFEA